MLAAPFASLSKTLCAPNNPNAKTVMFGSAPAGMDAEASNTIGARNPPITIFMSLVKTMALSSARRLRSVPNPESSSHSCCGAPALSLKRVDAAIVPGRRELPPVAGVVYYGFVDPRDRAHTASTITLARIGVALSFALEKHQSARRAGAAPADV